jgi:ankyrin repeat protein
MDSVQINKQIRGNIKSYLANRYGMVVSLTSFKADRMDIRNTAASLIQDKFICYLSRACLRLKRYERWFKARSQAVVTIQARARGNSARFRVAMLIEKVRGVVTSKAVLKIQTCFRAMCGRRTVRRRKFVIRWIAADIIINWYRARHSRKIAHQISLAMYAGRANRGALRMQIIIRRFLAKCRVDRIRMRRLYATLFVAATTINCLVRRFLAKITVSNKRDMLFANKLEQEESARQAHLSEVETKIEEEQKALLESVDIFLQASLGNTAETEDIFKGLVDTEPHTPSDVNVTGDTILTIAAAEGNIELVRKCLLWGFDVNHRNDNGDTALTLVAKKNHFMLMQYLLSLPATLAKEMPDYTPLDAISEEDMGVLLVAAAVNSNESGMEMLMALLDLGLDVNSVDPISGMTAMHAVCEVGLEEAFQLLHSKYKADMKVRDNLGQTPLHKAAGSSYGVTQQILGLDPNYSSYMTDTERTEGLVERDANEKDCLLLAAIGGQIDTVDLLEQLIESFPPVDPKPKEPITWITSDMAKVANLVELGNVLCLQVGL